MEKNHSGKVKGKYSQRRTGWKTARETVTADRDIPIERIRRQAKENLQVSE